MLDEITKSIKATLYERATSPLFGAFIASWAVWNYKTIFVLLSAMPTHEKFDYIETFIYANEWSCLLNGFLYPFITALLFLFAYPYPALYVYKFWHEKQIALKEAKQKIEDETPLTIEESRNIRRELFRLESEHDKEVTRKDAEIGRMKTIVENLQTTIDSFNNISSNNEEYVESKTSSDPDKNELDEDRIEILKLISKGGGTMKDKDIISASSFDKVKTEYYLEDLENNGYLSRKYKSSPVSAYVSELTTISKQIMVEIGFAK